MICYDTIQWYVRRDNVLELSIHNLTLAIPNFMLATDNRSGLLVGRGYYRNLRIHITPKFVRVSGSVPRFLHGTNLKTIDLSELASFFKWFTDVLGIYMQDIIITRIDIAANLKMEYPPICYFDYLGESTYMERVQWTTSLYYKQDKRKEYILYDKGAEVNSKKKKKITANLLRPELKLSKDIAVQLGMDVITAADLCSTKFFDKVVEKWIGEYSKIEKIKPVVNHIDILHTSKPKGTLDCHHARLISEQCKRNPRYLSDQLKMMRQLKIYSHQNYYTQVKDKFEELLENYTTRKRSDLEAELTCKINSVR